MQILDDARQLRLGRQPMIERHDDESLLEEGVDERRPRRHGARPENEAAAVNPCDGRAQRRRRTSDDVGVDVAAFDAAIAMRGARTRDGGHLRWLGLALAYDSLTFRRSMPCVSNSSSYASAIGSEIFQYSSAESR